MTSTYRHAPTILCHAAVLALSLLCHCLTYGQDDTQGTMLQTSGKHPAYYIDVNISTAYVFQMGIYDHHMGTAPWIIKIDTLYCHADSYSNASIKLIEENGKHYLVVQQRKIKKLPVDTAQSLHAAFGRLNEAFFLDTYFNMCNQLDVTYPLSHHSRWNGYKAWEKLTEKEQEYRHFRALTTTRIKGLQDSISLELDRYTALTNYLLEQLKTIQYNTLKDSLLKLPVTSSADSKYFSSVIKQVAADRPEYYFKLAEDLPDAQLLFRIIYGRKLIRHLKEVNGHEKIKKEFSKAKRSDRFFSYYAIGSQIILVGLIIWGIGRL